MPDEVLYGSKDNREFLREMVLDFHSVRELVKEAVARGIDEDPEIQRYLENVRRQVLSRELLNRIAAEIEPVEDDAILQDRYIAYRDLLESKEERKFSHILVKQPAEACACNESDLQGYELAQDLYQRIQKGSQFSDLVAEYSQDPKTIQAGGRIDAWMNTESKVEEPFLRAGFKLSKVGDVSKPVQTRFGYHLIRLDEIREPSVPEFEDVRATIQTTLFKEQRESAMREREGKAYPNLDTINYQALFAIIDSEIEKRNATKTSDANE